MTAVSAPWPPRTYITQPFALSINPEEGEIPTVDTCPAGSKTRRKASRRQAVQRAAGNSESHSSPAGSTMALGTDCVARSTWVCCHAEMSINQSINHNGFRYTYHGRTVHSLLGVLRLWYVRVPSIEQLVYLVQVRHTVRRCSRRKQQEYMRKSASQRISFLNTRSLETRSPFCFTFSKGTTRSDNKLGTPLRCAVCCCCCCGGCGGCCCNTDGGRCMSSLTPGGN
jgi:hypothetical protein